MEDLERLVAGRLRALDDAAPSAEAPPALLARVGHQVKARRRRRRITQSAAGLSLAAAVAVVAPPLLDSGDPSPTDPSVLAASEPADRRSGSALPSSPRPGAAGGLPRDLPSGKVLNAFGITSDGAVLGTGVGPRGRSDGVLWRADVSGLLTVPAPVAEPEGMYGASGSRNMTIWAQREGGGYQLMCRSGEGEPVRLGAGGIARRGGAAFHADRDVAVWTDKADGTVWAAHGCDAEPERLASGYAAGFAYPHAYVLSTDGRGRPTGEVQRVQVETGARQTRELPRGHLSPDALYAAGSGTFSVASGRTLTVYDTETWQAREVPEPLPRGEKAALTAGDGLVVYTAQNRDADRALVYETGSGQARVRDGEAYAKGEWLLTREGEAYRLTSTP
ncbi:hypothetical protein [Actinocorallia populi]|uniref:hypothetical protein n=1 Tax=Actinocorallia populi TaxID=2079200 RepID=UPI000D097E7F|nr:hypothetical protein [Actinocorallia populi]